MKKKELGCKHSPKRLYSWFAYDGVLCIACCDCGKVLKGTIKPQKGKRP